MAVVQKGVVFLREMRITIHPRVCEYTGNWKRAMLRVERTTVHRLVDL